MKAGVRDIIRCFVPVKVTMSQFLWEMKVETPRLQPNTLLQYHQGLRVQLGTFSAHQLTTVSPSAPSAMENMTLEQTTSQMSRSGSVTVAIILILFHLNMSATHTGKLIARIGPMSGGVIVNKARFIVKIARHLLRTIKIAFIPSWSVMGSETARMERTRLAASNCQQI